MELKDEDLSEDYRRGMEHLQVFLADREEWRAMIRNAQISGKKVAAEDHAMVMSKLHEFDRHIDRLEAELAKEYDRLVAEKEKEAEISKTLDRLWEDQKRIYLMIKHQTPQLLAEFEKCLDPLDDDQRERFFDEVAILETTKLEAVLNGTDK